MSLKSEINQNRIAIALPFNLEGSSTLHPSISPSGERLFFASDRPGGFGGMDLYYVTIKNGQYSEPINLGPDINTAGDEVSLSPTAIHSCSFLPTGGKASGSSISSLLNTKLNYVGKLLYWGKTSIPLKMTFLLA